MLAALILNPAAGRLSRLASPRSQLESAMIAGGFRLLSLPEGDLDAQFQAALDGDAELLFVAGGDGTLRGLAARMLVADRRYALLPGGTMNRVCARLGLPNDPLEAIACYRPGAGSLQLDVAMLNGEPLLYQSVIGRPARMLRFREMQRGGGLAGWIPLVQIALRNLFRAPWRDVTVPLGARRRASGMAAVVTLPTPAEAGGLTMQLLRPRGVLGRMRQIWRWFHGRLHDDPDVLTLEADQLVLHGRGRLMRVSLDGELMALPPPLRFRLRRGALNLLRPETA